MINIENYEVQWGSGSSVTIPTAFPTANMGIATACNFSSSADQNDDIQIQGFSRTGFRTKRSYNVFYIVTGY